MKVDVYVFAGERDIIERLTNMFGKRLYFTNDGDAIFFGADKDKIPAEVMESGKVEVRERDGNFLVPENYEERVW